MHQPTVTQYENHLFAINDLLTVDECTQMIAESEAIGYERASLSGRSKQVVNQHIRNNDRVIYDSNDLAEKLWKRVEPFLPKQHFFWRPVGLNERFRFYRYDPGQRFVWHMDGSFKRTDGDESKLTLLFYLNDVEDGGATSFKTKSEKFRVEPATGKALFFLHKVLHQGEPVVSGRKYVLRTDVMYRADEAVARRFKKR